MTQRGSEVCLEFHKNEAFVMEHRDPLIERLFKAGLDDLNWFVLFDSFVYEI